MEIKNLEHRRFIITGYCIGSKINDQRTQASTYILNLEKELADKDGFKTANVLLAVLKKEIEEQNAKLSSERTRLDNFRPQQNSIYKSRLFRKYKIKTDIIDQRIKENPVMGDYDIFVRFLK